MPTRLNTKQWAHAYLALADDYWPAVLRGARVGGERARAHLVDETSRKGAVDTGAGRLGWKSEVVDDLVRLWNARPHMAVVDGGRRPGAKRPPTAALIPWVRRKLGVGADEARGVAFVLARAIGRRGQQARRILGDATAKIATLIEEEIRREVDAAVRGGHR